MFEISLGLAIVTILAQLAHQLVVPRPGALPPEAETRARGARTRSARRRCGPFELARRGAIVLIALGILAVGLVERGEPAPGPATTELAMVR
jgi:hypothetical protein